MTETSARGLRDQTPSLERLCSNQGESVRPGLRRRFKKPLYPAAGISQGTDRVPNAGHADREPQQRPLPVQRFWFLLARCEKELARKRAARGEIEVEVEVDLDLREEPHRCPRGETILKLIIRLADARDAETPKGLYNPPRHQTINSPTPRWPTPAHGLPQCRTEEPTRPPA